MHNVCVYTVLLGEYERLNEQPVALASNIPFICFTDNPHLKSDTWEIRLITPLFPSDSVRSQRDIKIRAHVYLPEFQQSLYIDNTVLLKQGFESLIEQAENDISFAVSTHSFRHSVLDEFIEVAWWGMDSLHRIWPQLNHYYAQYPSLLIEQPYWTGILLRHHHDPLVCKMQDIWAAQVHRYSRRDQLSLNYALRAANLVPQALPWINDNLTSQYHTWPIRHERKQIAARPYYASLSLLDKNIKKMVKREMKAINRTNSYLRSIPRLILMLLPPRASQFIRNVWESLKIALTNHH